MKLLSTHESLLSEIEQCQQEQSEQRLLIAIVGPPAAGKSTLTDVICQKVNARQGSDTCVVLPMDGFHLDNAILDARGQRSRKGAPHTFDVDGFAALLKRVKCADTCVYAPSFDRKLDVSRNAAICIQEHHQVILVEGNYLLLEQPSWDQLFPFFSLTVRIDVPEPVLKSRLVQRWVDHNLSEQAALQRAEENDLPNMKTVIAHSRLSDIIYLPET